MSKMLLVEDNEINRDMLSRRLERKAFEVMTEVDGQACITMVSSDHGQSRSASEKGANS